MCDLLSLAACLTVTGGEVYSFGFNYYGQRGLGTNSDVNVPTLLSGTSAPWGSATVTSVVAGYSVSFVLAGVQPTGWLAQFALFCRVVRDLCLQ